MKVVRDGLSLGTATLESGAERVNSYAVVFYAGGALADFLEELREDLQPGHPSPRAHVTVLPPRSLGEAEAALHQLRRQSGEFRGFDTVLGGVHAFEGTNVVYLSVAHGFQDLYSMHRRLNQGALEYNEPYPYHPHITLAQGLSPDRLLDAASRARQRWAAYRGPRHFSCRSMFFVQGTADAKWVDLAEVRLG